MRDRELQEIRDPELREILRNIKRNIKARVGNPSGGSLPPGIPEGPLGDRPGPCRGPRGCLPLRAADREVSVPGL